MTIKVFTAPRRTPHFEISHLGSFSAYPRQSPSSPPSFVSDISLSLSLLSSYFYLRVSRSFGSAFKRVSNAFTRLYRGSTKCTEARFIEYYLQPCSISNEWRERERERERETQRLRVAKLVGTVATCPGILTSVNDVPSRGSDIAADTSDREAIDRGDRARANNFLGDGATVWYRERRDKRGET